MSNYVFVVDSNKTPLNLIHPKRARILLSKGKASVLKMYPFTIILKACVDNPTLKPIELKIDPGSKVTGLAVVQDGEVVWGANLEHRGNEIKKNLQSRAAVRRSRRNRKTRYRFARFLNRKRSDKWLPPSLMHRVSTIENWVKKVSRIAPVITIAMELVKFDMQALQNPEIQGKEYQQGELFGYEVREYLLEKWHRECVYCQKGNLPLEVEHIQPKSMGGSDKVSNLTLACRNCNQKKGNQPIDVFLQNQPDILKKIKAQAKTPFIDAAAVNSTRWKLFNTLEKLVPVINIKLATGTGGQTKYNRIQNGYEKDHWIDAACVGSTGLGVILKTKQPLKIKACGVGTGRQMTRNDKYGFPNAKAKRSYQHGWKTGDIARFTDGTQGRVVVQSATRARNSYWQKADRRNAG